QIGGIASTSVIIITLFAPVVGYLLYRKNYPVLPISVLAVALGAGSIWAGVHWPLSLDPQAWMGILTVYCVLAAGLPVWLILQPRDFINSFLLYLGMLFLFIGVIGGGWSGLGLHAPAFNFAGAPAVGVLWPFLFITVACGAISGFHALVAGGTVSKQVSRESHAQVVGYGGMLVEGLLAILVTLTVAGGLDFKAYMDIVYPADPQALSNPVLAWALAMGTLLHSAVKVPVAVGTVLGILMVEGFVVTTLDTAVRLNRYLFEELWAMLMQDPPVLLRSRAFNSILSAALMFLLCYTNAFKLIWPIFGAANQLLAALGLIVVSIWLAARSKPYLFTLVPALLMMAMTLYALGLLLVRKYLPAGDYHLAAAAVTLMALAAGVIVLSVQKFRSLPLLRPASALPPSLPSPGKV
ncbi:MAG: carbon starvation CstA family protein, partial [Elusimicrobia bacterium]|nr:carbon starvation CstA family protein [Elusimicrobiota bacterium]